MQDQRQESVLSAISPNKGQMIVHLEKELTW